MGYIICSGFGGSAQINLLAGTSVTKTYSIKLGDDTFSNPCSLGQPNGGLQGPLPTGNTCTVTPAFDPPLPSYLTVSASVSNATGSWKLTVVTTATGAAPNVSAPYYGAILSFDSDYDGGITGETYLQITTEPLYEEVAYFTYPNVDGWYIDAKNKASAGAYVDFSLSGVEKHRIVLAGKFSQAAIDWRDLGNTLPSTQYVTKTYTGNTNVYFKVEDLVPFSINGVSNWFRDHGDPFCTKHIRVTAATTVNIPNLSTGAPNVVDGVTLSPPNGSLKDYVLVKDQGNPAQNGVYAVNTAAPGSVNQWVRANEMNTWSEVLNTSVYVDNGAQNGGTSWTTPVSVPDGSPTLGTTWIIWRVSRSTDIVVSGAYGGGGSYNPVDFSGFQTLISSSFVNGGVLTSSNITSVRGDIYTSTNPDISLRTYSGPGFALNVAPYVKSVISTTTGGEGAVVDNTYDVWASATAPTPVTFYPAVYNDVAWASSTDRPNILNTEISEDGGSTWTELSAVSGSNARYSYTFSQPAKTFTPTFSYNGDEYYYATFVFSAKAAGNYRFRVKPTADANPNVRSSQTIIVSAKAVPVVTATITLSAPMGLGTNTATLHVTTNTSDPYVATITKGSYNPAPSGPTDDIELVGAGLLSAATSPLSTASGTGTRDFTINIPAYTSFKTISQTFTNVFKVVVTSGTLTTTATVAPWTYSRPNANLEVTGATTIDLGAAPAACAAGNTKSITMSVKCTDVPNGTTVNLTTTGANLSVSPASFVVPSSPNPYTRAVTVTFTQPGTPITSNITGCSLTASYGSVSATSSAFQVVACVSTVAPVLSSYSAGDKGLLFFTDSGYSPVISPLDYVNGTPEGNNAMAAFYKIRVGGVADTTNTYIVQASFQSDFSVIAGSLTGWTGALNSSVQLTGFSGSIYLNVQRQGTGRGTYAANELIISVSTNAWPSTAPTTIYIRTFQISTTLYSNTISLIPLPTPFITPPIGNAYKANTTLYLEAGAGMLLCPVAIGVPAVPGVTYFGTTGTPVFSLQGSAGLFSAGTREIASTSSLVTGVQAESRYIWWEVVGPTPASGHTISVTYQLPSSEVVTLSSMPCKIVAKAPNINLSFADGNTVSSVAKGATITPTATAAALPSTYAIVKVKSTGVFYASSGSLSFLVDSNETAPAIYEAIYTTSPDPKTDVDTTGNTVVAIKGVVGAGLGCVLTSSTPILLVPAVIGTCFPPYIPTLNGLKLPNQITLTGASGPTTVTSWDFGPTTALGNVLNIPSNSKQIGHPYTAPTGLRFELVLDSGFYKLRTVTNGSLASGGLTAPLDILMELRATVNGGCVAFPYTLRVSAEACTASLTDALPVYSCDVYNRAKPDSPTFGGNGYETSTSGLALHSFIEDGFAVTPSELAARYGITINGTKIVTGAPNTYTPARYYGAVSADNYLLYATYLTNNGNATCLRKAYKLPYYKVYSPKSTWLPIPNKFFLGTDPTEYVYIPELRTADVLTVQLQSGISSILEGKLATDYQLVFSPISAPSAVEVTVPVSYTSGATAYPPRRVAYTVPTGGGGLISGVSYIVSIVNIATGCAYHSYDPAVSATTGTVKYMGDPIVTSGVTFTPVPKLDPCFVSVNVTATVAAGLINVKTVSLFETGDLNTPIAGWTNLTAVASSASTFYFVLPRNDTAFPTTRTSNISKSFRVKLFNASGVSLLATPATLDLGLKTPLFLITESNTNREPSVSQTYTNVLTVSAKDNTCCSSCSSGSCNADNLSTATISWDLVNGPSWLEISGVSNTPQVTLESTIPVPSGAVPNVQGLASVTYYNQVWPVNFSYPLSPTEAFIIGDAALANAKNGELNYTHTITVSNKPVSLCGSLTWTIVDRQVSGDRPLPDAVTLSPHISDVNAGVFSWLTVADPGASFPVTYTFSVQAACNGGNPAATPVKVVSLTVDPSNPDITSLSPNVGYFDLENETVTISGRDFYAGALVYFGNLLATYVVVSGDGETITCTPPTVADLGGPDLVVDVIVENPDSGRATNLNGYKYERQRSPILLTAVPSSGTPLGGTKVLLTGANFEPSSVVTIDGVEQPILAITPSTLLFVTYPHSVGEVSVVVSNSNCGGTLSTCPSITYTFRISPQILSVTPFNISASGNDPLFIVGTGFYENGTVKPRVLVDNFEIPSTLIVYREV